MGEALVYGRIPKDVPKVDTKFRKIRTKIPVPGSIPILEKLQKYEPLSMGGQPLVVWDQAEGCQVFDKWGNVWLDWSSGVLVANSGHSRREICNAIKAQVDSKLLHNYCFPSEERAILTEKICKLTPRPLDKVFLLTTGSETTECAIKLARTHGLQVGGRKKIGIVTFERAFHGRTLGAQMAGGWPESKSWIVNVDPDFFQVPFPDGYWTEDTSFDLFLRTLEDKGLGPDRIAGVMTETYQGGGASFAPPKYMQELSKWCKENDVLLIMDEIQAGFGRTGTLFGFEHYDMVPDLICLGKGFASCVPISAVVGRADILDLYGPRAMTSTHTGNPVCVAAAIASIDLIVQEKLAENSAKVGKVLHEELNKFKDHYPDNIGTVHGKGLVAGVHMISNGKKEPDGETAFWVVGKCVEKGLMMFAPVGYKGCTIKICPPLTMTEEMVMDGAGVLEESIGEVLSGR